MTINKFLAHKYILVYFLLLFFDSLLGKSWDNEKQMDENFRLLWNIKWDKIFFQIEVKSHGYLGIGFAENGLIDRADICLGYMDDGESIMQDFHVKNDRIEIDESQDCELQKASKNRTHTVFRFYRKLETCDWIDDISIKNTTIDVLFFYTDFQIKQKSIMKKVLPNLTEIYKGSSNLYLNQKPNQSTLKYDPTSMRIWELHNQDVELPQGDDTVYWCKFFKLPDLISKHHIIRYEPIYDSKDSSTFLRHINLYECQGSYEELEELSREQGRMCYDAKSPSFSCNSIVASWVATSEGFTLPNEVGISIEPSNNKYYLMETHYTNQNITDQTYSAPTTIVDNSGLKLTLTTKLRKHDAGIMTIGIESNWRHIIPPGQRNVYSEGHCIGECTKQAFPYQGINLLAVMFRTNLIGKETRFKIIRKNIEHELASDRNINANRQEFQLLDKPIVSLPGDQLSVSCVYDSSSRSSITLGGPTIKGEICQAMTIYYPKIKELVSCNSLSSLPTVLHSLGIEELVVGSNPLVISSPIEIAGMTLESRLLSYDWGNNFKKFQEITNHGSFIPLCRNSNQNFLPGTENIGVYSPNVTKSTKSRNKCDHKSDLSYATGLDSTSDVFNNQIEDSSSPSSSSPLTSSSSSSSSASASSKSKVLRSSTITESMSYSSTNNLKNWPLLIFLCFSFIFIFNDLTRRRQFFTLTLLNC